MSLGLLACVSARLLGQKLADVRGQNQTSDCISDNICLQQDWNIYGTSKFRVFGLGLRKSHLIVHAVLDCFFWGVVRFELTKTLPFTRKPSSSPDDLFRIARPWHASKCMQDLPGYGS